MQTTGLYVSLFSLCVMLFFAVKFMFVLPKDAQSGDEIMKLRILALAWLALVFAQCAALLAAYRLERIDNFSADGALLM